MLDGDGSGGSGPAGDGSAGAGSSGSGGGLVVTPSDLVAHAKFVDRVADAVGVARQAGESVRCDMQAYGKLCWSVPLMLDVLRDVLVDGLATAGDSLRDTAGRLRASAAAYQDTDAQNLAGLDGLRSPR